MNHLPDDNHKHFICLLLVSALIMLRVRNRLEIDRPTVVQYRGHFKVFPNLPTVLPYLLCNTEKHETDTKYTESEREVLIFLIF